MNYRIRRMRREEVDIAIEWAAEEGWNPGLYDAECFWRTDPRGWFVGRVGDEPVATISAVAYDKNFGFLGFYIVKSEYRGRGLGLKIWRRAMKYLGKRNVGLDGVVAQQENYKKSGFKLVYRNIRYRGVAWASRGRTPSSLETVSLLRIAFRNVLSYDSKLFPVERAKFLECWLRQPENVGLGVVTENKLVGYGVIRKCREGYKIGPLFADSAEVAEKLFEGLSRRVKAGEAIFLDVPEVNREAVKLARRYKMKKVFETARMYTQEEPKIEVNKVFGVTSFELG